MNTPQTLVALPIEKSAAAEVVQACIHATTNGSVNWRFYAFFGGISEFQGS